MCQVVHEHAEGLIVLPIEGGEKASIPVWYDWGVNDNFYVKGGILHFNSSMVRLGVVILYGTPGLTFIFQFQYGTIGGQSKPGSHDVKN